MPSRPFSRPSSAAGPDPSLDPIIRVFQPRIREPISRDRAVAMHTSLFGFFNELLSWKREDDEKARAVGGAQ